MPGYLGLQLCLELSQIVPIKDVIQRGAAELWSLARNLRNSGSDISVERDLAEVFGRGMICDRLERAFVESTKIRHVIPLTDGREFELEFGPGPTVLRALRERDYLATVIQLSFLSWTHNREQLADLISSSMRKRSDSGLGNGIGDPSVNAIMNTLAACSSQTSSFNWSFYTEEIQNRLKANMPTYQYSADYIRLTPALFLGAIDFLYKVQRFEEERRITVTNEIGSITLIVWTHYILGMTVSVVGNVSRPILFGDSRKAPHVTIEWKQHNSDYAGELFYPSSAKEEGPEIQLLDRDMQIVLQCVPDESDRTDISGEDRHPLLGWGSTYLRRLLNTSLLTADQDPIYEEIIFLVIALAINVSQRLDRDMEWSKRRQSIITIGDFSDVRSVPAVGHQALKIEYWSVKNAAAVIFNGFELDERRIESYVNYFAVTNLTRETCPTTFKPFLRRVKSDDIETDPAERLMDQVKYLARVVLIFSSVTDIKSCAKIPLRMTDGITNLYPQMELLLTSPSTTRAIVRASEMFHAVATFLSDRRFNYKNDVSGLAGEENKFLFLYSDFGWSILLDTVGHKDPTEITLELLHILPGTPTNIRTGERKYQLRDGMGTPKDLPPKSYPLLADSSRVPRCAAKVTKRSQYWVSRELEFQSTLFFTIEPSPEWRKQVTSSSSEYDLNNHMENGSTFENCAGYREMQESLWRCCLTPTRCAHQAIAFGSNIRPLQIGPDVVELIGWNIFSVEESAPQRILVLLTRDDPGIRWCALLRCVGPSIRDRNRPPRRVMIRAPQFCDRCALDHVASLPGRWVLIL